MARSVPRTVFGVFALGILTALGTIPSDRIAAVGPWALQVWQAWRAPGATSLQDCVADFARATPRAASGGRRVVLAGLAPEGLAADKLQTDLALLIGPEPVKRLPCAFAPGAVIDQAKIASLLDADVLIWRAVAPDGLTALNLTYASTTGHPGFRTETIHPPDGALLAPVAAAFVLPMLGRAPQTTDGITFAPGSPTLPPRQMATLHEAKGLDALAAGNPTAAIGAFEQAIVLYRGAGDAAGFARANGHLGDALASVPARQAQAVLPYQAAITADLHDRAPLDWAALKFRLARVMQAIGTRDQDAERLQQAVATHRAALAERPRDVVPDLWAQSQLAIGQTLLALGQLQSSKATLADAATALRAASDVQGATNDPAARIEALVTLAQTLHLTGNLRFRAPDVTEAVKTFQAAIERMTPAQDGAAWVRAHRLMAAALQDLGQRFGQDGRLELAADAYRAALLPDLRDRAPEVWSDVQMELGAVLLTLGTQVRSPGWLEESVTATRAALLELSRRRTPAKWAEAKMALGRGLQANGAIMQRTALLEQAITAYGDALKVPSPLLSAFKAAQVRYQMASTSLTIHDMTISAPDRVRAWQWAAQARRDFTALQAPHYQHMADQLLRTLLARERP